MVDIYISSFYRPHFTLKTVELIKERTVPGSYFLHVYDNGSDQKTVDILLELYRKGEIGNLILDKRNTGCLYNKAVFHALTETSKKYYVVTDNDIFPPKLDPDWLSQMTAIMDNHPELAFLSPQLPPQQLQNPYKVDEDIVYCKAVGNTFKLIRREAYPFDHYEQKLNKYGDDGMVSSIVDRNGWKVAFCRNIFCYHAGQCENWGYDKEQIDKDPRKSGYGPPFKYEFSEDTYDPESKWRI